MICLKEDWRHTVKFTLKEILKRYIGEIYWRDSEGYIL